MKVVVRILELSVTVLVSYSVELSYMWFCIWGFVSRNWFWFRTPRFRNTSFIQKVSYHSFVSKGFISLGASNRPPILEKGSYVTWASRFRRFLDNKQEEEERMWHSIEVGSYERQRITNPYKPDETVPEPTSKMTKANKKQYFVDIKVMNYLLQGIPNDIYNFVNACKDVKQMWEWIKRLMHGYEITKKRDT
ncbi:hypothetical protein Tco_0184506 [Tanacetum coccineum]